MAKPKKGAIHQVVFPLVDKTDFATLESGLTASDLNSKIGNGSAIAKFIGWNTGVSTATTSGTISKALSQVRSHLFKAILKTTENNYDNVMIRIKHPSTAEQIMTWSNVDNDDSDLMSQILLATSAASDAASAAQQANSRVLLCQSRISDVASYLVAMSDTLSDVHSDLRSYLVGLSASVSDVQSALSDAHSDLGSKIGGITASVSASDISDIASAVNDILASRLSDILSAAVQTNSRVLLNQSRISDVYSLLSDFDSDFDSRIPKEPAARSQLSDAHSDLGSKIGGITAAVGASDISDIASAVRAAIVSDLSDILSAAQQTNSRTLLVQSRVSDVYSLLSDFDSDFDSRIPKEPAARSQLSDAASDLRSYLVGISASVSDVQSALSDAHSDLGSKIGGITASVGASDISDIASAVYALVVSQISDILSAAQQTNSRTLLVQSRVSDVYSLLSDFDSDFDSRIPKEPAARSQLSDLASDILSDLRSYIGAGVPLDASSLSDLRSAIAATELDASDLSDIASAVRTVVASDLSDILSAAQQTNSRVLLNQSRISDVYSLLSDLHSDVAVMSGVQSDVYSLLVAGVPVDASSMSDLRSAITANGVLRAGAEPAAVIGHTDTMAAKVDWLTAMSRNKLLQTTTTLSLRNDADNADIASAAVSDNGTTYTRGEFA